MKDTYRISSFVKRKDMLLCVNSSGTVINGMEINHNLCYGPSFIEVWEMNDNARLTQEIWNEINIYEKTRGINRFRALLTMLERINGILIPTSKFTALENWIAHSNKLSIDHLKAEITKNQDPLLIKALKWSELINQKMALIETIDKKPFNYAQEALEKASKYFDIAVISGANQDAIIEEWEHHGLLQFVDVIGSQEEGSKSECVSKLMDKGYDNQNVMMIGDVIDDYDATVCHKVSFYPIIINDEASSWLIFKDFYLDKIIQHDYSQFQDALIKMFMSNFNKVVLNRAKLIL